MNMHRSRATFYRASVACLVSASAISLAYYLIATKPLTQKALADQQGVLKINLERAKDWWEDEVNNVREDLSNPEILNRSQLILRAKRHSRLNFRSPLSMGLSRALDQNSSNRNSVSLLTKGGIIVFSTAQTKLGMYQPLNQTTTTLELDELSTRPLKFFTDVNSGLPAVSVALPINDANQKRLGFLGIDFNLSRLNEVIKADSQHHLHKNKIQPAIQAYLAAHTTLEHVTLIAPPASFSASSTNSYQFKPLDSVGIQNALDGRAGQGLYLNTDSQPTIGVYEYLPNFRAALLVESLQHNIYKPARDQATLIFLSGILISIGLFLAGIMVACRASPSGFSC